MSSQPRKTSEFASENSKGRISRIAQPILRRSSTTDKQGLIPSSAVRSSAVRSSSAARASSARPAMKTPLKSSMRTPMKTPNQLKTPLRSFSNERQTILMTAEKAPMEDKKWIQAQISRVAEDLIHIDGLPKDFVQKGNLRTISVSQFILIASYYLRYMGVKVQMDSTNFAEETMKILADLDYPYTITKSSLKTPNAKHSNVHIIVLLSWLAESCIPPGENILEYDESEQFVDQEFLKLFVDQLKVGFELWNKGQEDELEKLQKALMEEYLLKRAGTNNIETDILKLKEEIETLSQVARPLSLEKELQDITDKINNLQVKGDKLNDACNEKKRQIGFAKSELNEKLTVEENLLKEFKNLKMNLSTQKLSIVKRNELLQKLSETKGILHTKRLNIRQINETGSDKEILLSNLIQKKFSSLDKLNNLIHTLSSEINSACLPKNNFNASLYEIKPLSKDAEIEEQLNLLNNALKQLSLEFKNTEADLKNQVSVVEAQIADIQPTSNLLKIQIDELQEQLRTLTEEKQQIDIKLVNFEFIKEKNFKTMEQNLIQIDLEIRSSNSRISVLQTEIERITIESDEFYNSSKAKFSQTLNLKQQQLAKDEATLEEQERMMKELMKEL